MRRMLNGRLLRRGLKIAKGQSKLHETGAYRWSVTGLIMTRVGECCTAETCRHLSPAREGFMDTHGIAGCFCKCLLIV